MRNEKGVAYIMDRADLRSVKVGIRDATTFVQDSLEYIAASLKTVISQISKIKPVTGLSGLWGKCQTSRRKKQR